MTGERKHAGVFDVSWGTYRIRLLVLRDIPEAPTNIPGLRYNYIGTVKTATGASKSETFVQSVRCVLLPVVCPALIFWRL